MAPFATIYSYANSIRVQRVRVIAALNRLEVADGEFQMGVTNKTPEFLAKWPLGKVPVLETPSGFRLAESIAIATYVAESGPMGDQLLAQGANGSPEKRAKISEWLLATETELVAHALQPMLMCVAKMVPYDAAKYDASAAAFERAVGKVETELAKTDGKHLVDGQLSIADVFVGSALCYASQFLWDAEMREKAPKSVKFLETLSDAVPEFKAVFVDMHKVDKRVRPE